MMANCHSILVTVMFLYFEKHPHTHIHVHYTFAITADDNQSYGGEIWNVIKSPYPFSLPSFVRTFVCQQSSSIYCGSCYSNRQEFIPFFWGEFISSAGVLTWMIMAVVEAIKKNYLFLLLLPLLLTSCYWVLCQWLLFHKNYVKFCI